MSEQSPREPGPGEILLPRWVVLTTMVIAWVVGGAIIGFELVGRGRFAVLALGAWLITLPVVATNRNPLRALRELFFGGGR